MNDLPSEIGKKIISLTSPTAAHYISYANPEIPYLQAIRYEYKDFIDAVNRGDYDEVVRLIPKIPIEIIQDLQNDFKFFDGIHELILLHYNSDYFRILEALISSGMSLNLSNMKTLVDIFSRDIWKLEEIFLLIPVEKLEWYIDVLIETYDLGQYLRNIAKVLSFSNDIHLHIFFTERILNLADNFEEIKSEDNFFDRILIAQILVFEADNIESIPKSADTEDVLGVIYENIRKFIKFLHIKSLNQFFPSELQEELNNLDKISRRIL